jgi:hypothetical protein
MVYGCIFVGFGGSAVAFSMAEMASMYVKAMPARPCFCNPTITNVLQRSGGWRAVSVVDEFRTMCTKVLGLDSRLLGQALIVCNASAYTRLGWLTVGAWVISCAGTPGVVANIIMGLVMFNNENYEPKAWHISLTMWALIAILFVSNLWFRQVINAFELFGGISHIIFFISSITTLAVLAHHSSPGFVFNTLTTGVSGWNNPGVCWGIGLLTLTYSMTGL